MYKEAIRPAWVEISLDNLRYNINSIQKKIGNDCEYIGVIKADAYGHGSVKVAEILREEGVKSFGISTLQEAVTLRENGAKEEVIMMGLTPNIYADIIVKYDIIPAVCSFDNARAINDEAVKCNKIVDVWLKIDTGMGRIGLLADEINNIESEDTHSREIEEIKKISELSNIRIKALFSHMSVADIRDKDFARGQERKFNAVYDKLKEMGIEIPMKSLANSATIMELESAHFDAVRSGIVLYGCYPSDEVDQSNLSIKPVMSVKANIVQLKHVPEGFSVGYGRKFIAKRPSVIATLALGYADGYPRPYSSVGKVIVNGQFAPIAGNICMDQCMVDVTDVESVKEGDEVILMGSDGKNTILADDIGNATGTINYEICCAFGQRLPKVYV